MAIIDKEIQLLMLKGEKGDPGISGDYNELANKPKINGVELLGNKTASDLGLASEADLNAAVADIATNTANIATNTTNIGALNNLTTTVKSSLVAAINEVNADTFSKNVEYGAWTPELTWTNSGTPTPPTYSQITWRATYYKIGKLVYAAAQLRATITSAGAPGVTQGVPVVGGLPYPTSTIQIHGNVGVAMATQPSVTTRQLTTETGVLRPSIATNGIELDVWASTASPISWKIVTDGWLNVSAVYLTDS